MTMFSDKELASRCINTIRVLAADTVEKAKSGHPGAPMGLAPLAFVLWSDVMRFNPSNASWVSLYLALRYIYSLLYSLR